MPLPLLMLVVFDRLSENEEVLGKTDFFCWGEKYILKVWEDVPK